MAGADATPLDVGHSVTRWGSREDCAFSVLVLDIAETVPFVGGLGMLYRSLYG